MRFNISDFGKQTSWASNIFAFGFVGLATIVVYFIVASNSNQARFGTLELTNLPDQYCPLLAAVVATDENAKVTFSANVAVDACRYITLGQLFSASDRPISDKGSSLSPSNPGSRSRLIFVKIRGALAFRVPIDSLKASYRYAPSLGDVNDDNVIDSTDENAVTAALFSNDSAQISNNDLDQDRRVSVLDLVLTRINRRAGVSRPDDQSWGKL